MTPKSCENPACQQKTLNNRFCSRSCAQTVNNALGPKRERTRIWKCKTCPATYSPLEWGRKRCKECIRLNKLREKNVQALRRDNQLRNGLRLGVCQSCGYDKHTELAHIKPVASFPLEAPFELINDPSNVVVLCRNCHWELDHDHPVLVSK